MLTKVVAPLVGGVVMASLGLFLLISSQTSAPAQNPASQEIIVYGDR